MAQSLSIPSSVKAFMNKFSNAKFEIYIVGGAVRNLLLSRPIDNWDFTTNATPEQIQKLFIKSTYNNTYGTVVVKDAANSLLFEVTPFRRESGYEDRRHPSHVKWASTLKEDVLRRDFTINALAYDGEEVVDYVGGKTDLKNTLVRAVGKPQIRFQEDALRLLRAIRLASQLGFMIEDETRRAIADSAHLISSVSWERIRDELFKILASDHPSEGILFLRSTGLLRYILPELDACFDIPQKSPKRHHVYDVGTHQVLSLKACPSKDPVVRFAALIHDIGKVDSFAKDEDSGLITFYNHEVVGAELAEKIARRLRLSTLQRKRLCSLVRHHMFSVSEKQTDKSLRRFIRTVGVENLPDILALREADRVGSGAARTSWRTEEFKSRLVEVQKVPFQIRDLKIGGADVMDSLNIPPSPRVGEVLGQIFEKVDDGSLPNERKALLKELKKFL